MKLSLAVPIESRNGLPFSDSYILNGYVQSEARGKVVSKRPGLSLFHQFSAGTGQGMFEIGSNSYAIIADTIYLCQAPFTSFVIPSITTAGLQYDVISQPPYISTPYAVIKTTAGMWVFDGTTVTKVVDVNYPATTVRGVCFLDGAYYVKTPAGIIQGSSIGTALTWPALNYLTASDVAGASVAIAKHLAYIVSFGVFSLTFYYDAVNPPPGSPLGAAPNLTQEIGCATAASIAALGDNLIFMSQVKKNRSISMMIGQSLVPTVVSSPDIDSILNLDSLTGVTAFTSIVSGRMFYLLTLPTTGVTLSYNVSENSWTYWASGTAGAPVAATLTLGTDLLTVSGVLSSGVLLPGQSFLIADATNQLINGVFTADTASGANFTYTLNYNALLIDNLGRFLVTGNGEFIAAVSFPVAGPVAGSPTVSPYGTAYFSGNSSTGAGLILDSTTGAVTQLSPTAYTDSSGSIDFNIVTPNLVTEEGALMPISSAEILGDKTMTTGYLRYTDTDYASWSLYRPLDMLRARCRTNRLGATRRRAFHFRHVGNTPLRVSEIMLGMAE